jgi:hypothetical protein
VVVYPKGGLSAIPFSPKWSLELGYSPLLSASGFAGFKDFQDFFSTSSTELHRLLSLTFYTLYPPIMGVLFP